ncbi:MAG: ATP-binding protein [Synechococcales bacterium]|nr:ATP-binding protein [Synechococcales bacterium]
MGIWLRWKVGKQQQMAQHRIATLQQQNQTLSHQLQTLIQADVTRQRELLLANITAQIRRSLNLQDILQTAVEEIHQLLGVDRVHVTQVDDQGYSFVAAEKVSPGYASIREVRYPPEVVQKLQAWYAAPHITQDTSSVYSDPLVQQFMVMNREQYQVQASISIPLGLPGSLPFGLLSIHQCSQPRNWQNSEIELLTQIALQMEVAIQQGKLYEQVRNQAETLEDQVAERTLQLQENMEALQQSNQIKERLLHAVAHDLQTPLLGTLMVFKRFIKGVGSSIEVPRPIIERILDSTQRQIDLLHSLANEDKEMMGLEDLKFKAIEVPHLIQTALQKLTPLIQENQVEVQVAIADNLPLLHADPACLERIMEQLVENAIRHNSPGVQITLSVQDLPPTESKAADQHSLNFEVRDNGKGIAPKQLELLFKTPYLRSTTSRRLTGMGMGLYLCHQMIKAHGGTIAARANIPHGLILAFQLPLTPLRQHSTHSDSILQAS